MRGCQRVRFSSRIGLKLGIDFDIFLKFSFFFDETVRKCFIECIATVITQFNIRSKSDRKTRIISGLKRERAFHDSHRIPHPPSLRDLDFTDPFRIRAM